MFQGLFSSNHSTIELITQTLPEDSIASKNHEYQTGIKNISCIGEKRNTEKNHPPWKEKHIGQVIILWKISPTGLNFDNWFVDKLLK